MNGTQSIKQNNSDRQHLLPGDKKQMIFDVSFGIVIPLVLLIFDPFVFRDKPYSLSMYAFMGIGMLALLAWLFLGNRYEALASGVAGILYLGIIYSYILGLVLLLFVGLGIALLFAALAEGHFDTAFMGLIGLLGIFPFFTATVYYRNWKKAKELSQKNSTKVRQRVLFVAGIVITILIPGIIQLIFNPI
jgi:hypothetical protein